MDPPPNGSNMTAQTDPVIASPTVTHIDGVADLLALADEVFYDCFVVRWESLNPCQPPRTVQECDDRLIKFAGAAVLEDGSIGHAPYAGWGVVIDGKYRTCGKWGVDPDAT